MSRETLAKFYKVDLIMQFCLAFLPALIWINFELINRWVGNFNTSRVSFVIFLAYIFGANFILGILWTAFSSYLKYNKVYESNQKWRSLIPLSILIISIFWASIESDFIIFLTMMCYSYVFYFVLILIERSTLLANKV